MKLILSSCDFLNEKSKKCILDNIGQSLEKCKILFIPNQEFSVNDLDKYYKRLAVDGFLKKENIFIFNEKEVNKFKNLNIDLIYISGGNTFLTMNKIRKVKFDKEIIKYIKDGVTYIGGSCGAHIVSSNIKHVLNFDTNDIGIKNFRGLNLFSGIIIPHYDKSREKFYQELIKTSKYKVYPLTNDGTILINGDEIKIYDNYI